MTNVHRIFFNEDPEQAFETIFLDTKPKPDADTSRGLDLRKVFRSDKIKDLVVLNDETHHIRDSSLAQFKSIEDISNKLKLKNACRTGREPVSACRQIFLQRPNIITAPFSCRRLLIIR